MPQVSTGISSQRDDFNRLSEALIYRRHQDDVRVSVEVIDGRGGDEGSDIGVKDVASGEFVRICQVKHFPQGFSGGYIKRRAQIKSSYSSALVHNATLWTLVAPTRGTIAERKSVTVVQATPRGRVDDVRK